MDAYSTPGAYIQEPNVLPPSVVAVPTAIPAFIGYTRYSGEWGNEGNRLLDFQASRINSLKEYTDRFGMEPDQAVSVKVKDGLPSEITIEPDTESPFRMYYQVRMFFLNGGGTCYIIPIGGFTGETVDPEKMKESFEDGGLTKEGGLGIARKVDDITLLLLPDAELLADENQYYEVYKQALMQCGELKDRFVILDAKADADDSTAFSDFRTKIGGTYLNYGAAYSPTLISTLKRNIDSLSITYENLDGADASSPAFVAKEKELANKLYVQLPPSGAIAGVYAQTDRDRGVFKAPANVSLNGVIAPSVRISDEEQQNMNVDPNGKSINAIRSFAGRGTLVWGARTLDSNSSEWKYVNVRRFFIFAEESIQETMENFLFEPNTEDTWVNVRGSIENFLTNQWRAGALAGATARQAFFVRVGLGQTMTPQDILDGKLIVEVGMAVARPAEFIILRFTHQLQEA